MCSASTLLERLQNAAILQYQFGSGHRHFSVQRILRVYLVRNVFVWLEETLHHFSNILITFAYLAFTPLHLPSSIFGSFDHPAQANSMHQLKVNDHIHGVLPCRLVKSANPSTVTRFIFIRRSSTGNYNFISSACEKHSTLFIYTLPPTPTEYLHQFQITTVIFATSHQSQPVGHIAQIRRNHV